MPSRRALSIALLSLLSACSEPCDGSSYFLSSSTRWRLSSDELVADVCEHVEGREHMVAGARWCPTLSTTDGSPEVALDADLECYDISLGGPATLTDGCLEFTAAGAVQLKLTRDPVACEPPKNTKDEEVTFNLRVAAPADIRGELSPHVDRQAIAGLTAQEGRAFPPDITPLRDATTTKIVAGGASTLAINLWSGEDPVAWPSGQATVQATAIRGEPPLLALDGLAVTVTAPAGSEAELELVIADRPIPLGRIVAVDPSELRELDVVIAFWNADPAGARAVIRDGDGDLVYGAPVAWEVEDGAFPLSPPITEGVDADYVQFVDDDMNLNLEEYLPICYKPPLFGTSEYTGRITASFAGLSDTAEFTWKSSAPENGYDHTLDPAPSCEGPGFGEGCGCTTSPRSGDALGLAALLLLAARRRRRR